MPSSYRLASDGNFQNCIEKDNNYYGSSTIDAIHVVQNENHKSKSMWLNVNRFIAVKIHTSSCRASWDIFNSLLSYLELLLRFANNTEISMYFACRPILGKKCIKM